MEFKKKPIIIEAKQFTNETGAEVAEWCHGQLVRTFNGSPEAVVEYIQIPTVGSDHVTVALARVGDWIIKNQDGSFYFMDAKTFEATYEPLV